jgi:hypothetical protein
MYTAFLFAIYLVLGVAGWLQWARARKEVAHD